MSFVVQEDLLELTCTVAILCKIIGSLWEWWEFMGMIVGRNAGSGIDQHPAVPRAWAPKKKTRRNQSGFGSVSEVSSAATVDGSEIPFPTHRLDGSKTL